MKIRVLLLTLVGLVTSIAVPTFAQQKDTVDPQTAEQLSALSKKFSEAFNNNDAAAVAALYTEDAVLVNDTGPVYGREAIEKGFVDLFKQVHFSNCSSTVDRYSPHVIGTAGNEAWSNGEFTQTIQGQNFGPLQHKGNWIEIYRREGDTWRKRLDMWNLSPAPPEPGQTK